MALVQSATTLPTFLVALPAGVVADIIDRRRLLIAIEIWVVMVAAALAALTAAGLVGPAVLLGFTFLIGMGLASFLRILRSSDARRSGVELAQQALRLCPLGP